VVKSRRGDARFALSSRDTKAMEQAMDRLGIKSAKVRSTIPSAFSISGIRRSKRSDF
jgi:hypothetical protein